MHFIIEFSNGIVQLKGPLYEANPFLNYTFELCYK